MRICQNCGEMSDDNILTCWKCGHNDDGTSSPAFSAEEVEEDQELAAIFSDEHIILSTTSLNYEPSSVNILGLVNSEEVIGTDIFAKVSAGVVNVVGGSSEVYKSYIMEARNQVTQNILKQARNAGANGIVGIKYDYESVGNGMLLVAVSGTAVLLQKTEA